MYPSARWLPALCSRSDAITGRASAFEIARPMLVAAAAPPPLSTAVSMPTTSPAALTSGPPELPDEIAASVWMSPSSAPFSDITVRSSPDTMPSVTDG